MSLHDLSKVKNTKLFLISSMNGNQRSSALDLSAPLSYRERLLKNREHQLDKIRSEISSIIQHQFQMSSARPDHQGSEVYRPNAVQISLLNSKAKVSRRFNEKFHKKRRYLFNEKNEHRYSNSALREQLDHLGQNLTVATKKISQKQPKQQLQKPESEVLILPKLTTYHQTKAKFNKLQVHDAKIEPWRHGHDETNAFDY